LNWGEFGPLALLLSQDGWSSVQSGGWSVNNPVEVVSGSGVGFSAPLDFISDVVLSLSPCMVSLEVWGDVRVAVLHWVNLLLSEVVPGSWIGIWSDCSGSVG
jgi:hypothetical protein